MNSREALSFIKKQGVILMSARGDVPNLAEAIAGQPIRGSWWGHPKSHHIYRVLDAVRNSSEVLVCRLVGGKVTFVHRRLWPALVRLAGRLPKRGLAAIREEHTTRGHHRTRVTAFPRWVPTVDLVRAGKLGEDQAVAEMGAELFDKVSGRKLTQRSGRSAARASRGTRSSHQPCSRGV